MAGFRYQNLMNFRPLLLLMLALAVFFAGCSKPKNYRVEGARLLDVERATEDVVYDVLAFPITREEAAYLSASLDQIATAAQRHPQAWLEIQSSDNPVFAARANEVWKRAEVLGEDIIAINLKLTFVQEYLSSEEPVQDLRRNLEWLERRAQDAPSDAELEESADHIRKLLRIIDEHQASDSFAFYRSNQAELDAMLDRFRSIGE